MIRTMLYILFFPSFSCYFFLFCSLCSCINICWEKIVLYPGLNWVITLAEDFCTRKNVGADFELNRRSHKSVQYSI
jgi:hypothetical protein